MIDEGIEPTRYFPSGPFKDDRLIVSRRDFIEVVTPPGHDGLGTLSRLSPSELPIHAAAAVMGGRQDDWIGYVFAVRLPKGREVLAPAILGWNERRYLH